MTEGYDAELEKRWAKSGLIKGAFAGAFYGVVAVYAVIYDFGDAQKLEFTPLWEILILYAVAAVFCANLFAQLGRILFPYACHIRQRAKAERQKFQKKNHHAKS